MGEHNKPGSSPYPRYPLFAPDTSSGSYVAIPLNSDDPVIYIRRRPRNNRVVFTVACFALFFVSVIFLLWPSDPKLVIVQMKVHHIRIHRLPRVAVDISLALKIRVRNRDFFSIHYSQLEVNIGYRGEKLGHVWSEDGDVKPLSSSYVDAILDLDGIEVLSDAIYLLEDLSKGVIPFDTVTDIHGRLGLFFFSIPIKAKISCEVDVNPVNQTIVRQNCYPETS